MTEAIKDILEYKDEVHFGISMRHLSHILTHTFKDKFMELKKDVLASKDISSTAYKNLIANELDEIASVLSVTIKNIRDMSDDLDTDAASQLRALVKLEVELAEEVENIKGTLVPPLKMYAELYDRFKILDVRLAEYSFRFAVESSTNVRSDKLNSLLESNKLTEWSNVLGKSGTWSIIGFVRELEPFIEKSLKIEYNTLEQMLAEDPSLAGGEGAQEAKRVYKQIILEMGESSAEMAYTFIEEELVKTLDDRCKPNDALLAAKRQAVNVAKSTVESKNFLNKLDRAIENIEDEIMTDNLMFLQEN